MPGTPRPSLAVLCLALGLTLGGASAQAAARAAVADAQGAPASWTLVAEADGEQVQVTLDLPHESEGAAEAFRRLLLLPSGTQRVAIEAVEASPISGIGTGVRAQERIHVGSVLIMRGQPVAPLWIDAPDLRQLLDAGADRLTITLSAEEAAGPAAAPTAPGSFRAPATRESGAANRGIYLIITADAYAGELQPLVAWKTACGYDVRTHTISETGGALEEIEAFVRNAYETWDSPPLYLLLVGDVEDVATGNLLGNVSDHVYACMDGDDFLADLYVGRIVAKTVDDVALQVAKIVGYESSPDMTGIEPGDENTWFNRALMVAGNHGSSTPIPTSRWIADELLTRGFAQVDTVYYPPFSDGCSQTWGCPVGDAIDAGVTIITYRGWAREDPPGWDVPDYTTEDIVLLANGWKLPFVFSIVCNTGDFGRPDEDCFGEAFVKAGTVEEPRGAVGFIGTAEHWSLTRWNDRIALGLFEALCYEGVQQVGAMLAASKAKLLVHFPTEIYLDEVPGEEAVEFYNYIYNILGDPSLELWTAKPRVVHVPNLPRSIPFGANYVDIGVTEEDGLTPVEGARVSFVQDGAVIGYGITDALGGVSVSLAVVSTDPVLGTVTGTNLHPLQMTVDVLADALSLTAAGAAVTGSEVLVPGSEAEVILSLSNTGTADVAGVTATISATGEVEIVTGTTEFGSLAVGETAPAQDPVRLLAEAGTEDGARLRLLLTPTIEGQELRPTEFWLTAGAPDLVCEALTDGGDGVFDPGEEFDLVLSLRNQGSVGAGAITALLTPLVTEQVLTVVDSLASFAEIVPGATGENTADPFVLRLGSETAIGTVIPLTIRATSADGPVTTIFSNLIVGSVDCSAPVGPDVYGYYCYDSADIDYPQEVPVYRWIEISQRYGGPGTWLDIDVDDRVPRVVRLPFTFTYYGQPYDSVRISDNGWLAFDTGYFFDTRNWSMPDHWGSASQVAAFWDNLNPMISGSDGIYSWYDSPHQRYVIEWNRLMNRVDSANHWQSFEIVLYDPAYWTTQTGDGEIVFQYKHIINDDYETMYSTVGIEDQSEEIGIQYSYGNFYAAGAAPLAPGLALKFTTDRPVYRPIPDVSPDALRLRILSGNPSAGDTAILFRSGRVGVGEVAVYDAAGRRVRTLLQEAGDNPAAGLLAWDGRDASGQRVPSGLYWVRLAAGPDSRAARLVIIR